MGKALFGHFCAGALISGAIVIIIRNGRKFLQKETNVMKGISEEKFDRIEEIKGQAKACFDELAHKTSWPTRAELTHSAVVVLSASLVIALLVFLPYCIMSRMLSLYIKSAFLHLPEQCCFISR